MIEVDHQFTIERRIMRFICCFQTGMPHPIVNVLCALFAALQSHARVIEIPLHQLTDELRESVSLDRYDVPHNSGEKNLQGQPGLGYYIKMGIGTPAQQVMAQHTQSSVIINFISDEYFDRHRKQ